MLRALLLLYPAAFRAEYGRELASDFEFRMKDGRSPFYRLLLCLEMIGDVLISAAQTHWDMLRQDLRYTARSLSRIPGFTMAAITIVALGVGANTAVFSVTDHVLIRPLPFAQPERLVKLWEDQSFRGYPQNEPAPANYLDWKRMSQSFEAMAAWRGLSATMQGQGDPERVEGVAITAEAFPLLGVRAQLGRVFTEAEDRADAPGTVLLSHAFWTQRFAADPGVLGRKILLDDGTYTVIGVMPAEFRFPQRNVKLWTPMRFTARDLSDRTTNFLHVVGRLRSGVTLQQATAEMRVIATQLERSYPKENDRIGVRITLLSENVSQRTRDMLFALTAASACTLLIVCANIASLLLARALARRRELAVRSALGAGRERLVRQVLTESMVLSACGGILGVFIATWTLPALARFVPSSLPIAGDPPLNLRVLGFSILISCLTGLAFGVFPALSFGNKFGEADLREGSRPSIGGAKGRLWSALVVAEIAVCIVLVVSSGLLIRTLFHLQSIDTGFRPGGVLTVRTSLPMPKYKKTLDRSAFYQRVLERVRHIPNVKSAGYVSFLPLVMRGGIHPVVIEGQEGDGKNFHDAYLRYVTPQYLSTVGISLLSGRDVEQSDTSTSPYVAVVSESFARKHWPGENALGKRFQFAEASRTIVGIVANARLRGLERNSEPQVYLPHAQVPDGAYEWFAPKDLAVRVTSENAELVTAIRRIVHEADPAQPVSDVQWMGDIVNMETASRRTQLWLVGAFACLALVLASLGIHSLLTFRVSQRVQEIGVRVALGASVSSIMLMVLRHGIKLASIGAAIGLALALVAARSIEALLAGVKPADLSTFSIAIGICAMMTLAGSIIPTVRAVRIDPIKAIRAE